MVEILPAIIAQDIEELEDKMASVRELVPVVQIDVLDGSLGTARSWPYQSPSKSDAFFDAIVREEEGFPYWEQLEFEAHIMTRQPELIISDWIIAGASRIIVQLEGVKDFDLVVNEVAGRVPLGVAIALDTPEEALEPIADKVTIIQCMGWDFSNIGHHGRAFDPKTVVRVNRLRQKYPEHIISVDGGVNLENASGLIAMGANRLIVGSAIWESGALRENLGKFKNLK